MILKKLVMFSVLAAGLSLVGCKSQCESLCEQTLDCDEEDIALVSPFGVQQEDDCSDDCEEYEEAIEAAQCEPEFEALATCFEELDICDPDDQEECADEAEDFSECMVDYCGDLDDLPPECD